MAAPSEKSTKVSGPALFLSAQNWLSKPRYGRDSAHVSLRAGGIVNHRPSTCRIEPSDSDLHFAVEKRKTGEYLAAKVVSKASTPAGHKTGPCAAG